MGQIGEILGFGFQARVEFERGARTIVELLRERMDGVDRVVRRKTLAERLGLKNIGCCGSTWGIRPTTMSERDDEEEEEEYGPPQIEVITVDNRPPENDCDGDGRSPARSGMNLAAALAAERHLRAALDADGHTESRDVTAGIAPRTAPGTPFRVSLMRLLEEADVYDGKRKKEEKETVDGGGGDSVCCVCMGRKKGAAFIPCGHTFCRVCSRELWLNRGTCPLCNRQILEILDIY